MSWHDFFFYTFPCVCFLGGVWMGRFQERRRWTDAFKSMEKI